MITNEYRAQAAAVAIDAHKEAIHDIDAEPETALTDLLTSLRHYAKSYGLDWALIQRVSRSNFEDETK